jgi:hypothetical protein
MATRDELVAAIAGRYAQGNRAERGRILDEFAAVTGLHRKHAMRLLRAGRVTRSYGPRRERRVYDGAVREALIVVWEASDRICGRQLVRLSVARAKKLARAAECLVHSLTPSGFWRKTTPKIGVSSASCGVKNA